MLKNHSQALESFHRVVSSAKKNSTIIFSTTSRLPPVLIASNTPVWVILQHKEIQLWNLEEVKCLKGNYQLIEHSCLQHKIVTVKIRIINQSFKLLRSKLVAYKWEIMEIKYLNKAIIIYTPFKNHRLRPELDQLNPKLCKNHPLFQILKVKI